MLSPLLFIAVYGPHQQEDGGEGCHEETPLCRRPGPGGEWQTGATGDTGRVKWAVYQTRAENERREDGGAAHICHHREELDIELDGKKLTQGDSFVYLGGAVCGDGKTEKEVRRRVQAGANAWRAVEGVMADRRISKRLKGKVMSTCVTPACLYGAETLALTELQLPTRAGGREFNLRPGQYSRMSFSPDQVTGKVFSSEHAFPSKF